MLITISTTNRRLGERSVPATDLGYVLHKNPQNVRSVSTTAGTAHVFWPQADEEQATVALFVDINSLDLVRRTRGAQPLAAYINDRPYVASSFLSVAIGRLFRSALNGDCPTRPELVDLTWPVTVQLPAVPVGPDPGLVTRLFGPLGYVAEATVPPLDRDVPRWGPAEVASIALTGEVAVRDLLRHLYVLLPVLDNDKHYWIDEAEVEKLLRHGDGWLAEHPEHKLIVRRYLGNYKSLTSLANSLLASDQALSQATEDQEGDDAGDVAADADEATIEAPLSLNQQRLRAVTDAVLAANPTTVLDVGCGEGNLLQHLADESSIDRLVGVDVAIGSLRRAAKRLRLDRRPERQRPTVELRQSSLTYRDESLADADVACLIEVIEHLDLPRLDAVEPILFRHTKPKTVIVTTPNREYNQLFNMAPGSLRHRDHRFEWTRAEFAEWCGHIRDTYHYQFTLQPIGPLDETFGAPTQMAVLTRGSSD